MILQKKYKKSKIVRVCVYLYLNSFILINLKTFFIERNIRNIMKIPEKEIDLFAPFLCFPFPRDDKNP